MTQRPLPAPVTTTEEYLAAILHELMLLNVAFTAQVAVQASTPTPEEAVELREEKRRSALLNKLDEKKRALRAPAKPASKE